MIINILVNVAAGIFLKYGSGNLVGKNGMDFILSAVTNKFVFLSVLCYFSGFAVYGCILSKTPLNVAYPLSVGGTCLILVVFSSLFLKEHMNGVHFLGICLIVAGVVLINSIKY